jgi:hypothetical protein
VIAVDSSANAPLFLASRWTCQPWPVRRDSGYGRDVGRKPVGGKISWRRADHHCEDAEPGDFDGSRTQGPIAGIPIAAFRLFWFLVLRDARGRDERAVNPKRERKSSGSGTTFADDLTDPGAIEASVLAMANDVWDWCEKTGGRGRPVTVKVKWADFRLCTRSRSLPSPVSRREALHDCSLALIRSVYPPRAGIRLVGVTLSNFQGDEPGSEGLPRLGRLPPLEASPLQAVRRHRTNRPRIATSRTDRTTPTRTEDDNEQLPQDRGGRIAAVAGATLGHPAERTFRVTWWRGLRARCGHPTGSISASERAVRVRAPVLRLVFPH